MRKAEFGIAVGAANRESTVLTQNRRCSLEGTNLEHIESGPIKPFSFPPIWSLPPSVVYPKDHCLHLVTAIQFPLCSLTFAILASVIDIPSAQLSLKAHVLANILQFYFNFIKRLSLLSSLSLLFDFFSCYFRLFLHHVNFSEICR
jgi:hypothetical protein